MLLVLSDKGQGMQSSSEQPLVGEEHCVTTLITAAKETTAEPLRTSMAFIPFSFFKITHSPSLIILEEIFN